MENSFNSPRFRELAKLLKQKRLDAGLTLKQVAGRIHRHHPFVFDYEYAQKRLDVVRLRQSAAAVNVSLVALVREFVGTSSAGGSTRPAVSPIDPERGGDEIESVIDEWYQAERERFAALLRVLRKRSGLTEAKLGDRIAEGQSFVSKFENADRRIDLIELEQIASAVGTTLLAVVEEFEADAPAVPLISAD